MSPIMYHFTTFTILYCLVAQSTIDALLISPCPKIFTYEGEPENDRWYGVMTFSSNVELVGLTYKIQLDRPGHLLVSWDGEVRSEDNINFSVFDPNHFQRAREVVRTRIMVKFDPSVSPPNVVKVIINGNTVCSGDSNTPLTLGATTEPPSGRPDPFSVDEEVVPEYNNRPSNQNTNPAYEKGRPGYFETPNYTGGGDGGVNYNSNAGSGTSYIESGSSYQQNTGYQPPAANNNNPSYPTNNKNSNSNKNPAYSNSQGYIPAENIVYPSNHQTFSSFGGNAQPQWPAESQQQNSLSNNRNSSSTTVGNGGPVVTTLTIPNNTQSKNSVDTIIQLIKNQLEQQQGSSNTNNTVIVALVSPVNQNAAQQTVPNGSQNRDSLIETTHRTTVTASNTQSSVAGVSKARSTTSSTATTNKTPNNVRN